MTTNHDARFVLPSLGLASQSPKRGAVNVASAQLASAGVADAAYSLIQALFRDKRQSPVPDIPELDEIDPTLLASRLQGRIAALPDFTDRSSNRDSLRLLETSLRQQQAGRPGRLGREIDSACQEVLDEVSRPLQASIERAFSDAPFAVPQVVKHASATLGSLHLPEPDMTALATFYRIVRGINEISNLSGSLPRKSAEFVIEQLFTRALPTFDEALAVLAKTRIASGLKQRFGKISEFLNEMLQRSVAFRGKAEAIVSSAERARAERRQQLDTNYSSTVRALPGPTADNVIDGIQAKFQCDDRQTLLSVLARKWEIRLRDFAKVHHAWVPKSASLPELLTHLTPVESFGEFVQLMNESVGDGHTLYESVAAYGIEEIATDLYERAAPLCHLASRDIAQFNVHPTDCTIIRLPRTKGYKDAEIRRDLVGAFERLGACTCLEASDREADAIAVVRTRIGFPIGIEESNHTMLMHYAKSVSSGHLPHLLGVTSSELGEPIADFVNLALKFQNQETT